MASQESVPEEVIKSVPAFAVPARVAQSTVTLRLPRARTTRTDTLVTGGKASTVGGSVSAPHPPQLVCKSHIIALPCAHTLRTVTGIIKQVQHGW